jgi:nucleoside-diphosphate-sugar epimerase
VSPLVTVIGGSGFIGTRLVRMLQEAGHQVSIVDKAESSAYPELARIADVRDRDALREACSGSEVIYNLAAEHRDDVRPLSLYDEVNVGGARNTCDIARDLGISKLVFVSSVAVYGFARDAVDEDGATHPFNDYGRTKLEAEQVFEAWQAEDPSRSLTIVRPTVVFGEGNRGNVYNLLRQIAEGPFFMVGTGRNRKSMAYVENVAAFLAHATRFGAGVHTFNYVDEPDFDMNQLVATIRSTLGKPESVRWRLPYAVAYAAGSALDAIAAATGRSLPISRVRVQKFCADSRFTARRSREAGFVPPYSLEDALQRTIFHEFTPSRVETSTSLDLPEAP